MDQLGKTEQGFELIKTLAKNSRLNPNYQVVDGLVKLENGKAEVLSIVKQYLVNPALSKQFIDSFLPKKENMELISKLVKEELLGYNVAGKSFQLKKGKEYDKEILYTINSDNDAVRVFMFAHLLSNENDKKVKLQNILKEVSVA